MEDGHDCPARNALDSDYGDDCAAQIYHTPSALEMVTLKYVCISVEASGGFIEVIQKISKLHLAFSLTKRF